MRMHPEYTFTTYTKHYYIGSERINSKLGTVKDLGILCEQIGGGYDLIDEMNTRVINAGKRLELLYNDLDKDLRLKHPYLYSREHQIVCDFKSHDSELYDAYWYHPDHLGSSSYITNTTGEISQHMEYLPFGETLVEEHLNSYNSPFKFNAKEYDAETGNYYYGARYMNPKWSTFLTPDPALESYPGISPYAYTLNNPIRYVDPTGMYVENADHIIVTKGKKEGTYVVISGVANNDRGVYLDDGKGGRGERVGTMKTTHSFFNEKNKAVAGAVIDTESREGQNFIDNEIIADNPNVFHYKNNATLNEHYDFKSRGLDEKNVTEQEALIHRTRGSMTLDGEMASARDFGNIAAGIVAGRAGIPHWLAKKKFNQLQGGPEPPVSAKAQQIGLNIGTKLYKSEQAKRQIEKIKNGFIGPIKY